MTPRALPRLAALAGAIAVLIAPLTGSPALASAARRAGAVQATQVEVAATRVASATPAAAPVAVAVLGITPSAPRPGDTITVTARATNTTTTTLRSVRLRLRVGFVPVPDRPTLAAYAAGTATELDGPLVTAVVRLAGTSTVAPASGPLAPGASTTVTLSLQVSDLGLRTAGAYPLAVEARAATDGGIVRVGGVRTFLPFVPTVKELVPTRLAWLVALTDLPRRDAAQRFLDDGLDASLTRGGRLARLVAVGTPEKVTWAVDPSLVEDVVVMSRGYQVRTAKETTPGAGTSGALSWLSALREAATGHDVLALGYAHPDAVALHRAGLDADLTSATTRAPGILADYLGSTVTGDVGWTPGAHVDAGTAEVLRRSGERALVVDGRDLPTDLPMAYTPSGRAAVPGVAGAMTALVTDPVLTALAASDTRVPGSAAVALQRFLAETLTITAERPGDSRTMLVAPPALWNPDPAYARAILAASRTVPWLAPATLAELRAEPSAVLRSTLRYPAAARAAERSAAELARVSASRTTLQGLADVLTTPDEVTGRYDAALLRTTSAGFRGPADSGAPLLRAVDDDLATWTSGVRVLGGTATLPDASATFPLTLVNDLDQAVKVRLVLDSSSPRLRLTTPGLVTIPANRKIQIRVQAEAALTGAVPVVATLRTPTGQVFGSPTAFVVRLTKLGRVALVLVVGAGTFLAGAVVVQAGRRIRKARAGAAR